MDKLTSSPGKALFLVWASPTHGSSRSRLLTQELGMDSPRYVYTNLRRGPLFAPLRYLIQAVRTMRLLFKERPRTVLIQSPPSFAVLCVALYAVLTGSQYIIDAHSGAFQRAIWNRPRWLYRRVARRAVATLVTDTYFQKMVEGWGAKALVMRDPVTQYPTGSYPLNGHFNLTLVCTYAADEPLKEVLGAAAGLPDVHLYITGKVKPEFRPLVDQAPANVTFTGFLPDEQFYGLLKGSHAVMSLTTRNHTLQCGACEALSLQRPVITSNWPLLREYFSLGTVHVDNTAEGIRGGIEEMRRNHARFEGEIAQLREVRFAEWQKWTALLANLVEGSSYDVN
jgi:hypothetical protein